MRKRTPEAPNDQAPPEPSTVSIGPKLKAARQKRGLSLRALGDETGFSASFLSQIELGQASPSLASLERIARSLGVTLAELLSDAAGPEQPVFRRRSDAAHRSDWSRATLQSLLPAGADERVTAVLIAIQSGGRSGKEPQAQSGRQLAYCVRGALVLTFDDAEHVLRAGDSVFFDATRPHRWESRGKSGAEVLLVTIRLK